jgi:aspartate aminotransferase-like enzyme
LIPRKSSPSSHHWKRKRQLTKLSVISTGVLADIKGVAKVVKSISPETIVVVDGVCSVGSEEIRFDEWNLDVVITASQKALGVPPGLGIVVASQHAMQVFKSRKTPVASYYSNWNKWLPSQYKKQYDLQITRTFI